MAYVKRSSSGNRLSLRLEYNHSAAASTKMALAVTPPRCNWAHCGDAAGRAEKKALRPPQRKLLVGQLLSSSRISVKRACCVWDQSRAGWCVPQGAHFAGDFLRLEEEIAGLGVSELRRLKQLEEENRKLKQLVADLSLDKVMLQDVLKKKL